MYAKASQSKFVASRSASHFKTLLLLLTTACLAYSWIFGSQMYDVQKFTRCPVDLELPDQSPVPKNRARVHNLLTGHDLVLLGSAPDVVMYPGSDMELSGWRQTSNILYILGRYDISKSFVLLNTTGPVLGISLFLPDLAQREIVFNGDVPDKDELIKKFELVDVYSISELPDILGKNNLTSPDKNIADLIPEPVKDKIKSKGGSFGYSADVEQAFVTSRFRKSPEELDYLRYAGKVARLAHKFVGEAIEDGHYISESGLASFFVHISTICKCRLQAYPPIVGAGAHAGVLHFPTGQDYEAGYGNVDPTDFILIDAAGAYDGYASDLTRTYATKSSDNFKELHRIVEKSQLAGLAAHVKGNTVI